MAADTAQKRLSALNLRCPLRRGPSVVPVGSDSASVRQAVIRMYSGIIAGAAVDTGLPVARFISVSNIRIGL